MTDNDPDEVIDPPNPEPETSGADRDNDRLATELFRRYGSVIRGRWREREHWEADATAIRTLLAGDAAFERIVEALGSATVRVSRDPEERAAIFNDGFDEAWRQRDDELVEDLIVVLAGAAAASLTTFAAGWLVGRGRRP